jgi:hypothetical protein
MVFPPPSLQKKEGGPPFAQMGPVRKEAPGGNAAAPNPSPTFLAFCQSHGFRGWRVSFDHLYRGQWGPLMLRVTLGLVTVPCWGGGRVAQAASTHGECAMRSLCAVVSTGERVHVDYKFALADGKFIIGPKS